MANSEQRRQQKLAKQRAKKKQQAAKMQTQKDAAAKSSTYAKYPIADAIINEPDPTNAEVMKLAILSRETPDGRVAMSVFMIDTLCLGVKNGFFRILTRSEYKKTLVSMREGRNSQGRQEESRPWTDVGPEYLRKLVDESVKYAKQFGFTPHRDYAKAYDLFGDVDADACPVEFTFGKDGKPFYIAGPHESPAKSLQIIKQLEAYTGPNEFDYVVEVGESDLSDFEGKTLEE